MAKKEIEIGRSGRRSGKSAMMIEMMIEEVIEEMKHRGGGTLVVCPQDAKWFADALQEAGATVVCTLGCDWPKEIS